MAINHQPYGQPLAAIHPGNPVSALGFQNFSVSGFSFSGLMVCCPAVPWSCCPISACCFPNFYFLKCQLFSRNHFL